jgi:hypothetical protein
MEGQINGTAMDALTKLAARVVANEIGRRVTVTQQKAAIAQAEEGHP